MRRTACSTSTRSRGAGDRLALIPAVREGDALSRRDAARAALGLRGGAMPDYGLARTSGWARGRTRSVQSTLENRIECRTYDVTD